MSALASLLAENRAFAAEFGGGLTNHASMALIALARLGATDERLGAFFTSYRVRLEPRVPSAIISAIEAEIAREGAQPVLRRRLRAAAPGLAGGAFHGVIRLAFAVQSGVQEELAPALAYLEECVQPLMPFSSGRETEVGELAEELRRAGIDKPAGFLISERLTALARDPRFTSIASRLRVDRTTVSQVSGLGARWYLAADDFATLHVLTGAHAVRALLSHLDDPAPALHALAVAALGCFVLAGAPSFAEARGRERAEWSEIEARAVMTDDDHLAKLVVACRDEERDAGDAIYRIVATHVARRGHT